MKAGKNVKSNKNYKEKKKFPLIRFLKKFLGWIKKQLNNQATIIQSVCSIISVVVIGVVSLSISDKANEISDKANEIANKQLQISIAENKPIITFSVIDSDDGNNIIEIHNEGVAPISYNVDVVTFFTFLNSENYFGKDIVKIYTFGDSYILKTTNDGKGNLAELNVFGFENKYVKTMNDEIQKLVNKYNDGLWQTEYIYIVRVECVDIFENHNYTYYMYDGFEGNILTEEFGKSLVDEWEYVTIGYHEEDFKDEPSHFVVRYDAATPEKLLGNAVKYMRDKNLYAKDIDGNIAYYGEFEPDKYFEDLK